MKRAFAITLAVTLGLALAVVAQAGRDSSGTMTFTSVAGGYPFVSGQVISSSGVNANMAEIITELSDSASRSGKGGFTAPVRGADGAVGAPTFSFTSDTDSGWYRIGANNLGLALGGVKKIDATTTGVTFANGITVTTGGLTVAEGNVTLSQADAQRINKSGGAFVAGTLDNNYVEFVTSNVSRLVIDSAGVFDFQAGRLTDVGTPTDGTDAVTKTYADALVSVATTTMTASTGFNLTTNSVRLSGNTVTVHMLAVATTGGNYNTIATLPSGYRPAAASISVCKWTDNGTPDALYFGLCGIATSGVVSLDGFFNTTGWDTPVVATDDEVQMTFTFVK